MNCLLWTDYADIRCMDCERCEALDRELEEEE